MVIDVACWALVVLQRERRASALGSRPDEWQTGFDGRL